MNYISTGVGGKHGMQLVAPHFHNHEVLGKIMIGNQYALYPMQKVGHHDQDG